MKGDFKFKHHISQLNTSLMSPVRMEDPKIVLTHNKNDGLYVPKDENLDAWKKEYIVPWGTFFDIFIVLLYLFFAISYQNTKVRFVLNFNQVFDDFFMGDSDNDEDELTYLYFKDDIIKSISDGSSRYFSFLDHFPSQDIITQNSNLSFSITTTSGSNIHYTFIESNVSNVSSIVTYYVNIFHEIVTEMEYMLIKGNEDSMIKMKIIYRMTFKDVDQLGIIEWRSQFIKTETTRTGSNQLRDHLSIDVFPIGILIFDSIAMILTILRFVSFVRHAREYAKKNYVRLYVAILWKVDLMELFNIGYQLFTFIMVALFITLIDNDLGGPPILLVLLGLAGFVHSVGVFRSLRMKKELWMVAQLIIRSLGRAFAFILGFIPFYFGYVMMGLTFFGYFSNLFKGFLRSMKILFSLMHTDVCMDTQDDLKAHAVVPDWGVTIYIVSWLTMTGGIVINVLISMVEVTLSELMQEKN